MNQTISFDFECFNLPGCNFEGTNRLRLGIQEGSETIMDVPADIIVAYFHFHLVVRLDEATGKPKFKGPFAQGSTGQQFVYLTWGTRGETGDWKTIRRLKIPLYHLSWQTVDQALQSGSSLRTRIRMTDRRGEPAAGTISPEDIEWL